MISGFQNHLHLLYGLPGGFGDNSDILDVYAKRRREEQRYEEQLAADILRNRQLQDQVIKKAKQINLTIKDLQTKTDTQLRDLLMLLAMGDD